MIELDVTGSEAVIEAVKKEIDSLSAKPTRSYRHGGIAGEAGVFGVIASVATAVLPKILEVLKPLVAKDRNLKVSVNGLEFTVRDLGEANDVLNLLSDRGLLPARDDHGTANE
jgi:hypothetical protein